MSSSTPRTTTTAPFLDGLSFGEGLRWRAGRLWWSDFYLHTVSSASEDGAARVEATLDDQPSGLGWLPDGRLLVVAMTRRQVLRREHDGTLALHAELGGAEHFHANDMLVDARGNAFVGSFGFDLERFTAEHGAEALFAEPGPPRAPLVRVAANGATSIAAEGLRFPNGTALLPDGRTVIVAETFAPRLTAFDLAPDGTLSNRRVWAPLPGGVAPDGICVDAEGAVWCANAHAPECVRIGEGGAVLERVTTSMNAFCCVLGGSDGHTLFVATARADADSGKVVGCIERVRVAVPASD